MANLAWRGEQFAKKNRFQRRWYKLMLVLASVVVFCTTYALILPAITMEQQCQIPEHQHTDACYTQITTVQRRVLTCRWDDEKTILHHHDGYCYDENGNLQCDLPEVEEHIHNDDCYQQTLLTEGHTHSDSCDTLIRGELICQAHVHTEDCYSSETTLVCEEPVTEGHAHGDGCYDEEGNLTCTLEETPGHSHLDDCYETTTSLICGEDSDHVHTDTCYAWETVRTCDREECEPTYGEPELICTEEEIRYHVHDESCYGEEGTLICEQPEVSAHQHDESCWQMVEDPLDTETLTCTQEEGETHTHTPRCYGTWELSCGMEEHSHGDDCLNTPDSFEMPADDAMLVDDAMPETDETTQPTEDATEIIGEPLNVETYITGATLFYKKVGDSDWTNVSDATNIPGNASFQLKVNYENVKIEDLIQAGYRMTYTPPEIFRNVNVSGDLLSGQEKIGIITVGDGKVILTFNQTWVNQQKPKQDSDTNTGTGSKTLSGDFTVEAQADLAQIPGGGTTEIVVGETKIAINFDKNLIAKYGEVKLEKKLVELKEEDDGDYLYYTLTVTAGQDGCPDVVVKDTFTTGKDYVESYIVLEPENANTSLDDQKTLTWTIGDMTAGETRTLSYKVKLTNSYLGVTAKDALTNKAEVYSNGNRREEKSATFTPQAKATLSKVATDYVSDTSGGGTIRYTVWVKALESNNYTLDNVTIWDALDGKITGGSKTDEVVWKYLAYVEDSFQLYEGGSDKQNGAEGLNKATAPEDALNIATEGKNFTFNVGDLKPGDCKTLVYTVKVSPELFVTGNADFKIGNRAAVLTDPSRDDGGNAHLNHYNCEKTITAKKWAQKQIGAEITEDKTIPVSGPCYDSSGTVITGDATFTVPKGSYQYTVNVNEAGDWDVSSAVMKDSLSNQYMHYVGYVQVQAYQKDQSDPVKTVWVKIDGARNFEFTPEKIGLTDKSCSYKLTYYAIPENLNEVSQVIVANTFNLTGTVGIYGKYYTLSGINVEVSVTLQGSNYFSAEKNFWYYDANAKNEKHNFGTIYWVIRAQGNVIPNGTAFKDSIAEGTPHSIGDVEKAFIAKDVTFTEENNLQSLANVGSEFTAFGKTTEDGSLVLTLTENVSLNEGESLYFIVSTYPSSVPTGSGVSQVYKNALSTKDPGEGKAWQSQNGDLHYIVSGNNIDKTMQEVFTVTAGETDDTTKIEYVKGESNTVLQKDYLRNSGSGVYVAWYVSVNHTATLNGRYRIQEKIPQGMGLVYVQRYSTAGWRNVAFQNIDGLGSEWERFENNYTYELNKATAIYYVNGQDVIWEFEETDSNPAEPNSRYVDYLVVCKVVDESVLLGGGKKTYVNNVTLSNTNGVTVGSSSAAVELSYPSLSKSGTYTGNTSVYPFKIEINELGMDLVPGAETIQLIDELCDVLILNESSIKVTNSRTNADVDFQAALEDKDGKHILTLTLPDDQPLTITYETTINAAPGQQINIQNDAHWQGYSTANGGSVKHENFSYSASGTANVSETPVVTITKVDGNNLTSKLSGATFTLQEMEFSGEELVVKSGGLQLEGTTNADGTLEFGNGDTLLAFNTIYCLTETKAPDGYVKDSTPHYFAVAKKEGNGTFQTFPQMVTVWYGGAKYSYTARNYRGEIKVTKKFANVDNTEIGALSGSYTFGLFTSADATEPLKTATFTHANGVTTEAVFKDVTLGTTYYVYELDDDNNPIKSGSATVSGIPFIVSYEGNGVTVAANSPTETVTVTNRINYPELPNTGGAGTNLYTVAGAALIAVALWLMYNQRKRRGEGS